MRYRPFGRSGLALSTVGLNLSREKLNKNHSLLQKLITTALENGINTYHFDSTDPKMLQAAAEVFAVVERKLLFVSVGAQESSLNADPAAYALPALKERLRAAIKDSGLAWLDLLVFSEDGAGMLPEDSLNFIKSLQRSKMLRYVAVEAEATAMPAIIKSGHFDVIKTTFDIDSSWDKRRQIDSAISREMNVMASGFFPDAYRKASDVVPAEARRGWFGMKAQNPLAGAGTHAFLHQTADWTPEELCLGYALSQPSLACIFVEPTSTDHLEALASVPERHLPPSVPAQIEMARFSERAPKSVGG